MTQQNDATIGNAGAIIERFGGIRPMASKINVPVTTVQGWKKRNVIPAGRLDQILEAARTHNLDISDIVNAESIANQNTRSEPVNAAAKTQTSEDIRPFVNPFKPDSEKTASGEKARTTNVMPNVVYEDLVKNISEGEKKVARRSLALNIVCLLIAIGAIGMLLWPQAPLNPNRQRIQQLEQQLADLRAEMNTTQQQTNAVSQNIAKNMAQMGAQISQQVQDAGAQAVAASAELFGPTLDQMQTSMTQMSMLSPQMEAIADRIASLAATPEGIKSFDAAWSVIVERIAQQPGLSGVDLDGALENIRVGDPALVQALEGVQPEDVRSGMEIFALSYVQNLLGRDTKSFTADLSALKAIVGNDDPELTSAISEIQPYAQDGVMTAPSLAKELQRMSDDIVTASLEDGDMTLTDRAKATLNNIVAVEKDGELISGIPVQSTISRAIKYLQDGNVDSAVTSMQSLEGASASASLPWIKKASTTLMAQRLRNEIMRALSLRTGGVTTADAPVIAPTNIYAPTVQQ